MDADETFRWALHYVVIWAALAVSWVLGMDFWRGAIPFNIAGMAFDTLALVANSITSIIVLVIVDQLADRFILGE